MYSQSLDPYFFLSLPLQYLEGSYEEMDAHHLATVVKKRPPIRCGVYSHYAHNSWRTFLVDFETWAVTLWGVDVGDAMVDIIVSERMNRVISLRLFF